MAITTINIGTEVNDGTGDAIRSAFDKVNTDFLYLDASTTFNNKLVNSNIFGGTSTLTVNEVNTDIITANVLNINALTVSEILTVANTTQSTDIYTGAIVTTGGLGVAQTAYIGGDVHVLGNVYGTFIGPTSSGDINNTRIGTTTPRDAVFSNVRITEATSATGFGTGALRVTGGISAGNVWVAGNTTVANLTVTNQVRGSLYLTGSDTVYINGAAVQTTSTSFPGGNVGFQANFNATTSSTDAGTGAVVIKGGLGVAGNINVGGFIAGGNLNLNTNAGHLELGNVDLYANGAIFGNLRTAAQPSITSVGALNGLTVSGNIVAGLSNQYWIGDATVPFLRMYASRFYGDFYGLVQTAAQPSITSVGPMSELVVEGTALLGDASSNVVVVGTATSGNVNTGALVVLGGAGIVGNLHAGAMRVGQLTYSDNNVLGAFQNSVNTYNQMILQNSNAGSSASSDYVVNNDQSTASSYYGDFGINSSNYSGSGSLARPNAVYLTATTGDLVLGTTTSNAVRVVVNSGTTDAVLVDTSGNVVITAATASTGLTSGALVVAGGVGINGVLNIANTGDVSANLGAIFESIGGGTGLNANIGAFQVFSNANAVAQSLAINSVQANLTAYQNSANANIGTLFNGNLITNANLGAFQTYANANIGTLFLGNVSTNANLGAFQRYANANIGAFQVFSNANAAVQATSIDTINSTLGSFFTYANSTYATSAGPSTLQLSANIGAYQIYANANVVAIQDGISSYQTYANANVVAIQANLGAFQTFANANIATIQANLGAFQRFSNANVGAYQIYANANVVAIQANLGAFQTFSNANSASLQNQITGANTNIQTTSANLGAFQAYANTKIGTNTNSNLVVLSTTESISSATGALVVKGGIGVAANITTSGWILPTSNVSQNLGSSTAWWNVFYGKSVQAQYADLAEMYVGDAEYAPGTVVVIGGNEEVTVTTQDHDPRVAGVVSTDPAYLMNSANTGLPIALTGRVPCLVQGPVTKGALLVTSATPGVAQMMNPQKYQPGCVIGKSLQSISDNDVQVIEIMVGRF